MANQQILSNPLTKQNKESPLFTVLWRAYKYLKPYWKLTAGAYLSLLAILGLSALIPQFIRWIIDTGIDGNQPRILIWSALALIGLTLLKGIF